MEAPPSWTGAGTLLGQKALLESEGNDAEAREIDDEIDLDLDVDDVRTVARDIPVPSTTIGDE